MQDGEQNLSAQAKDNQPKNADLARGYDAFRASLLNRSRESAEAHSANQKYWRQHKSMIDLLTLIFLAGYTTITYRLMSISQDQLAASQNQVEQAKTQTDISREALLASDRPWVDVDIEAVRLSVEENQVSVNLRMTYRNVGRSPAQQVMAIPRLTVEDRAPFSPAKADCDDQQKPSSVEWNAVFPGATPTMEITTGIPMREIKKVAERSFMQEMEGLRRVYPGDLSNSLSEMIRKSSYELSFHVVGCVTYFIPGSQQPHHTSFYYGLYLAPRDHAGQRGPFDTSKTGAYSREDGLRSDEEYWGKLAT